MRRSRLFLNLAAGLTLIGPLNPASALGQGSDVLYIGDAGDNTIKSFDASSYQAPWAPLASSEGPDVSHLAGPRGMVRVGNELLVVNQNLELAQSGEVLRYDAETGDFIGAAISSSNPNAPFAPDGIVLAGTDLLVASVLRKNNTGPKGSVNQYAADATLLRELKVKNNEHHPRGVVFGPDGQLYVSARDLKNGLGGTVLRYGADGKASVFIEDKGGFGKLNRPDGLVFGPDGCLYVTSFRAAGGDTDSIRIYDSAGNFLSKIDLHNGTTDPRVYAQFILFGPGGELYVPLIYAPLIDTNEVPPGEVRRYHSPNTGDYDVVVPATGGLLTPWSITFGKTNPSTLNYEPDVL